MAFLGDPGASSVLVQLRLNRLEQGCVNECRHGDRDPLVFGDFFTGVATARVGWTAAWRTKTRANRRPPRFAKRRFAFVGRVFEQIPDGLVIPVRFARARPYTSLMQTATHRIDRAA